MSVHHVRQVQIRLERDLVRFLDLSDLSPNHSEDERAKTGLSRALAAFALQATANIDAQTAAQHVTDGSDDQGIDALYFEPESQVLILVQSKWHSDGRGSVQVGDALKTIEGIKDILNDEEGRFNPRLKKLWNTYKGEFQTSLQSRIDCYFVYSGTQDLSQDVRAHLDQYRSETNEINDLVAFKTLNLRDVHNQLATGAEGRPIELEVLVRDWGKIDSPHQAVYGRVSAGDVAEWLHKHNKDQLLSKNIRKILPDSEINDSILKTIEATPDQFWYYNNGITILCKSFTQKAMGAGTRDTGIFALSGVSIVNGAQTAGAISRCSDKEKLARAFVQIRIISLENAGPDIDKDITRATNTQNRIESKDFASLDSVQARLRSEMLIVSRSYLIKAGEKVVDSANQVSIDEAAVALACALADVDLSTISKNSVGRIWEAVGDNEKDSVYRRVFPSDVASTYLWNCVQVLRAIESELVARRSGANGKTRLLAIHGNRLLAHLVFQSIPKDRLHSTNFKVNDHVTPMIVERQLEQLGSAFVEHFPKAYPASVLKNQEKCRVLASAILKRPAAQP